MLKWTFLIRRVLVAITEIVCPQFTTTPLRVGISITQIEWDGNLKIWRGQVC